MQKRLISIAISMLAALGLLGAGQISFSHWVGDSTCPTIGLFPACYIILIGYGFIFLSIHTNFKNKSVIFLVGWIPVILLALVGVLGELTSTLHCPQSERGIPKCYFSATLSLMIGFLYWHLNKAQENE